MRHFTPIRPAPGEWRTRIIATLNAEKSGETDRALVVNEAEASIVKLIYQRYLELGWVRLLKDNLDRRGIISKVRVSRKGIASGGRSFSRGALYELLSNPIYIGEIRHRQERHRGQHEPILERDFWETVQARLSDHARRDSQSRVP